MPHIKKVSHGLGICSTPATPARGNAKTPEQDFNKLSSYLSSYANWTKRHSGYPDGIHHFTNAVERELKGLDNSESGEEQGNGSITAKTWNNFMKKYSITGHNIKEKISIEEAKAFVLRHCHYED